MFDEFRHPKGIEEQHIIGCYRINPNGYLEFWSNDTGLWLESTYQNISKIDSIYPIVSYEDTWAEPTYEYN